MKLLTANIGWASTNKKLFWTTDGGAQWKDITPKLNHKRQEVSSVFFLDGSTGWVLLHCGDDRNPKIDDVCFEFASTTDAGQNWSVIRPKIMDSIPQTDYSDWTGYSGTTFLSFADPQHGWAVLRRSLPVGRSSGEMLRTVDGGLTWTQLPKSTLPIAENFQFFSPNDGWLAGGPDQELYVTRDAGNKWQRVDIPAPKQISPDLSPVYDLPTFVDGKTGYLPVTYESSMSSGTPMVLFKTDDGGRTWHPTITTPALQDTHAWAPHPSAITNGVLLSAGISGGQINTSRREESAEPKSHSARILASASSTDRLSFVNPERGWILAKYWLLSTTDGGVTWTDITPDPAGTVPPLASSGGTFRGTSAAVNRSSLPVGPAVSNHLGFDTFPTPPLSAMQAWSTSSPFYDVYVYLYGSPNKSTVKSKYPNKSWLSTVEGTYGWGVIPIWFGLQSTCVNATNITQFISTTPATASTQGAQQADLAVAADQALGITSGIIYVDIESYTVDHGTCSLAVQAYVDGFVSEIHTYGSYIVGVYANPGPISSDISNQNVAQPDTIWITKTPATGKPPQVTIWNQGIKDTLWSNSQRMHQFLMNESATFGSAPALNIDPDIDDGPVLNPNAIAKSYTYTATNIDCPGAIDTQPFGINDMSSGAFINGTGQRGTVVGTFQLTSGSPYYGFQNTAGSCTTINFPGAVLTEALGINNAGQIVGFFEDSFASYHGFLLNPGGSPTQIDYSGGGQTYLFGINDAGQIVGWAYSPGTFGYQTFMYYGGNFYPLGISGGGTFEYTQGYGINGQATLAGIYYYEPNTEDFELSATPSLIGTNVTWGGTVVGLTPGGSANTAAKGINANGELAGFYYSSACMDNVFQCGFEWSGGFLLTVLQHGADANVAEGLNDFAQVVGPYTDSGTGNSHGLLWTHQ